MKPLSCYMFLGFLFVSAAGTLSHFIYEWSGKLAVIGLFFPVNESTWEHMKLLFFPMLLYTLFLCLTKGRSQPNLCPALFAGTLLGAFSIPAIFYTYQGILGFNTLILDILVFFFSTALGFFTACRLSKKPFSARNRIFLGILTAVTFAAFLLFTVYPPSIGLFLPPWE